VKSTDSVRSSWTVRQLKNVVAVKFNRAAGDLRLVYNGMVLTDGDLVSSYNFAREATLTLHPAANPALVPITPVLFGNMSRSVTPVFGSSPAT